MDFAQNAGFWMAALGMTGLVAALLIMALMRGRGSEPVAAYDLRVYRDQLREVGRDLSRGVISPEDADRLRAEVSRRVLDADRALSVTAAPPTAPKSATRAMAVFVVVVLAGAIWTYIRIGAPGYPDLPLQTRIANAEAARENRPGQAVAEAEIAKSPAPVAPQDPDYLALVEKLRTAVATRPGDLQGNALLAQNEAGLGNYIAAYAAQSRVIALKADAASADDYAILADLMILAAGGYVSPEAEAALTNALQRDAQNGTALYYSGLMFAQTGRPDQTFRIWQPLLEHSPAGAPWRIALRAQLPEIAARTGENYTLPPDTALKGPSGDDIATTADMTPADRQAMIQTMVTGLSDRLATSGGSAAEWAQLITALGVLGDTEQAGKIWTEAQTVFAAAPADLETVRAAAQKAGIAP